jgi:diguanylate cyclase (GGDEF)-like protein/PAS domain S-box-containing protein
MASSLQSCPDDEPAAPAHVALLATVFEAVPFAMAVVDRQGALLYTNPAFNRDWSDRQPPLLADLLHPDDRERLTFSDLAPHYPLDALELRIEQPDGATRWAQVSLRPVLANPNAEPVFAVSFADITTLKRSVDTLAALESRWNNALVSSVTGVWDHNWATGEKYYSLTWRHIRGMTADDPLPESTAAWLELLHPEDKEHVIHCMERQNAGDPDYAVFEYRERHKDGHWVWIECRGDCVEWDENGTPTRIVGTDTDVTGRKLAEKAAARLSRRLDMALDISGVGTYVCDLTTGIVDWDDRMYRIYGLKERQHVQVGGLWESLLHPEDAERVITKAETISRTGERFSDQYRVLLQDGSERIIRARTMSFMDDSGHRMMVGANWDVTEDVGLHRELERAKVLAEARSFELQAAKERIEHSALHDYLTELPNRRYLDDMLERMRAECQRSGQGIALLHVDLDRFKQINDGLGHAAGDVVLQHAARTLRANIRKQDFIARVGGDEFIVVSRLDGDNSLSAMAERLIEALRLPVIFEGRKCRVGASIGIASATGATIDVRQLLRDSDIALYEAKRAGRNRFVFFSGHP